jgi:mono/diheme cytochrome c family protein
MTEITPSCDIQHSQVISNARRWVRNPIMRNMTRVVLIAAALLVGADAVAAHANGQHRRSVRAIDMATGEAMYVQYCASCHGVDAKGKGPAAIAMKTPPPDLTELSKHNDGQFPDGYVGAVVKFGKSLASHGSEEMPVWGARFKTIDPKQDPTGQQHVDDLIAYIKILQMK